MSVVSAPMWHWFARLSRADDDYTREGIAKLPGLLDHADVVLDLCTPVGDALIRIDGLDTPIGPGSSLRSRSNWVARASTLRTWRSIRQPT